MSGTGSTSGTTFDQSTTKDSYIPLFSGTPQDYREWRKRIKIYMAKMRMLKKEPEGLLNLIGSLTGTAWKLLESFPVEDVEKTGAFDRVLKTLDKAFEYDNRAQLPADFDRYFVSFQRRPGQTLLDFCTEHDELYNRLADHSVTLPTQVQGWHLLRKAGLSREQRQLVVTQAPTLERNKVQEALFLLLGQDHKAVASHPSRDPRYRGKGRGYAVYYETDETYGVDADGDDGTAESGYWQDWEEYDTYSQSPSHHGDYEAYEAYDEEAFDEEAAYYGDEVAEPEFEAATEQAAAYDSAYAAYLDARKRFNDIKLARGYLPIVALTDANANLTPGLSPSSSPSSKGPPKGGKGKGKGKGGKPAKGKGKSTTVRYPPRGRGKEPDPRGRAQSAMSTCLRCGQQGHLTYQCPVPRSSSPTKKRAAPTESTVGDVEHGHVLFMDNRGQERPDCAMIDPGASAFLSGYGPFKRYCKLLIEHDYDLTTLQFVRCKRTFFFGGDASSECKWTVKLPIFLGGGQFGFVQMYLLKGETPMLMGRPIVEALGLVFDCKNKRLKFDDTPWQDAVVGVHGEYLLPLLDGYDQHLLQHPPAFELVVPADGGTTGDLISYETFETEENLLSDKQEPTESTAQDGTRPLRRHQLATCDVTLTTLENDLQAYVTAELHPEPSRRRVLWEVYCGGARVSQVAEAMGMDAEIFGYETGWDFSLKSHREVFMKRLHTEMPDEVYLAPTCGPWSQMQNLAARTDAQKYQLYLNRKEHHDVHLRFVAQIYYEQVNNARHAHVEQPELALSWKTTSLKDLPGYWVVFHQCMFGCCCLAPNGQWMPVKKATAVLTTKLAMSMALHRQCDGQHEHCHLEGSAPGYGRRTTYMEDYQPGLAATIAAAIYAPEPPQLWEHAMAVPEQREVTGSLVKLHTEVKADAIRTVQRLHRNLGHPSAEALVTLLESRGASEQVLEAARKHQCVACLRYKKPNQPSPSSLRQQAKQFGDVLQCDVLWIRLGKDKFPILSILNQCTKYQVATLLPSERGEHLVHGLERAWVKHFGIPQVLCSDEGRGWVGDAMNAWTTTNSVLHDVAPGEAHTRLALVERRHQVLRKAVEIFLTDRSLEGTSGIRSALTYVLPQINASPTVAGFSPTQWVLGRQVRLPGELTDDRLSPVHCEGSPDFEQALHHRAAAKHALAQAEVDAKLRRALLRQKQGENLPLEVGQTCYFWRDARDHLVKIRWHGPARVVMRENHPDTQVPTVYWLAYKTQLIRAAPHHVRLDFTTSATQLEDAALAKREVASLKSRGVTRYLDLDKVNKANVDDLLEEDVGVGSGTEADDLQPPRQRPRLLEPGSPDPFDILDDDAQIEIPPDDYSPATPIPDEDLPNLEEPDTGNLHPDDPTAVQAPQPAGPEPIEADEPEPNQEPSAPTPLAAAERPSLDPLTASLYEPATLQEEDFRQRRLRVDQQETLLFGPSRPRRARPEPYEVPPASTTSGPSLLPPVPTDNDAELYAHAFQVTDIDTASLPSGWSMDEQGYLTLDAAKTEDYWEVRSGCVVRHHLRPRRRLHDLELEKELPFHIHQLDPIRVTMMKMPNGQTLISSDNLYNKAAPTSIAWTGVTVYQLNGKTRKEFAMFASQPAKKVARQQKHATAKKMAKKPELSERNMSLWEKEQFMSAKVKELKSFFENGVWQFDTSANADETRTLSSRMLLKWSKNADGSPRAKARLIVRGYADRDALEGKVMTAAPTTSRLSRSMFLSVSSTLRWCGWTADVSTAFLQGLPQERKLWVRLPNDALAILGAPADTRMYLVKPCYGQLDAPRRWWMEATRRLLNLGFRRHEMDPCMFCLYETDFDIGRDQPSPADRVLGPSRLCAIICIHVDDMLGGGYEESAVYQKVIADLKTAFTFREWQTQSKLEYCGASLEKTDVGWRLHHQEYLHKVKPISLSRDRGPADQMTASEVTQFRGLLGALQWPAVQSQPHLQCSTSMLASQLGTNLVKCIQDANKVLKFAKENSDVALRYEYLGPVEELRLVTMFDAAFCVRRDSSSQGGYITMLVNAKALNGEESSYHVIDWKSSKLPRVTRSSLGAEAQAAGQAADSVDFIARFWEMLKDPSLPLATVLKMPSSLSPTLVTDAKALYDSYHREGLGGSVVDKRTALEVQVIKQCLTSLQGQLRWISSERQFADSLTKESTRQLLADRLRYGLIKYTYDPSYLAAKRKDLQTRVESRDEFSKSREAPRIPEHQDEAELEGAEEFHEQEPLEAYGWMMDPCDYVLIIDGLQTDHDEHHLNTDDLEQINAVAQSNEISVNALTDLTEYVYGICSWLRTLIFVSFFAPAASQHFADESQCSLTPETTDELLDEDSGWLLNLMLLVLLALFLCAYSLGWYRATRALRPTLTERQAATEQMQQALESHAEQIRGHAAAIQTYKQEIADAYADLMDKDHQIELMRQAAEPRQRQLAMHIRLANDAYAVVHRALTEAEAHHDVCVQNRTLHIARRGRVWHFDGDCHHIHRADVHPINPCLSCACQTVTPYRTDVAGNTLSAELRGYLTLYENVQAWMNESDDDLDAVHQSD